MKPIERSIWEHGFRMGYGSRDAGPSRVPTENTVGAAWARARDAVDLLTGAKPTPESDAAQGALFDLPAPKPRNAVAEGR